MEEGNILIRKRTNLQRNRAPPEKNKNGSVCFQLQKESGNEPLRRQPLRKRSRPKSAGKVRFRGRWVSDNDDSLGARIEGQRGIPFLNMKMGAGKMPT